MLSNFRSDDFMWELRDEDEIYNLVGTKFDVTKAKKIIMENPRSVFYGNVSGLWEGIRDGYIGGSKVVGNVNIDFPLISAFMWLGKYNDDGTKLIKSWIVDGWNRIEMAMKKNVVELPVVCLNEEESKLCGKLNLKKILNTA